MGKRIFLVMAVLAAVVLALSCGKKGVPPIEKVKATFIIVSGNNQIKQAGNLLDTLKVRVVDERNQPVESVSVVFSQITANQGGKFPGNWANRYTDNNGVAISLYLCDTLVGADTLQAIALGANIDDSVVYFSLAVLPGPIAKFALDTLPDNSDNPDNQIGPAGDTLPRPFKVLVTDRFTNAIANHRIRYVAYDRSLAVTDSTILAMPFARDTAYTRTDANGKARAKWILPAYPQTFYPGGTSLTAYSMSNDSALDSITISALFNDPGPIYYYPQISTIFSQHCYSCHSGSVRMGQYALDFYYETLGDGSDATPNVIPGDSSCELLQMANSDHELNTINLVESDKILSWVMLDNAEPGSSGLNCYNVQMKSIFNIHCVSCHDAVHDSGSYNMSSFAGVRGNGTDAVANAIPGDSTSLLGQRVSIGGNMRLHLGADSVALADSVVNWIVRDSIRDY